MRQILLIGLAKLLTDRRSKPAMNSAFTRGRFYPLATKTETSQSSTDGSFDGWHSVSASSRKESSDDYTARSKFMEAMKNPNWRRRQIQGSSSDSCETDSNKIEVGSSHRQRLHYPSRSSGLSSARSSSTEEIWEHVDKVLS